jgi:NAD(P)-dependent dehydrogenase (short-subunit alcohol dehydrogenase family)
MTSARELQREIVDQGRACQIAKCDVTDALELGDVLTDLEDKLGFPDVVVYNAGVFPKAAPPADIAEDDLLSAIRVNTLPVLTLSRYYEMRCRELKRTGRVIILGSLGAREIWRDRAAYNTSKAAQHTLALSLARSLAPLMSINIVAPGQIVLEGEQESQSAFVSERRIPKERHGSADDVVDAVRYFARCSEYITGQTIVVDGGYGLVR